jgi:membrane associated rhomboid family serine protease
MTPAVKAILYTNVAAFLLSYFTGNTMADVLGLSPKAVFERLEVWRLATYLFIHDTQGFTHILFNMLSLWMFGVDLERRWGTRAFVRYYAITGIGAGIATAVISLLPFAVTRSIYEPTTIGASGAIYGLLLAWAVLFPHRQILFMFIFPLPARVAALLMGAMSFMSAASGRSGSVAEATHLSGLLIGWIYLNGPKNLQLDLQYRLTKWRMDRMRKRFSVHKGGRDGNGNWVH